MVQTSPASIRRAELKDVPVLLDLITGLAEFEKLPPPDTGARKRLIEHGFGEKPRFEAWLAEMEGKAVAYAILFETYSTFLALPTLYLEDLFVLPGYRRRGVGGQMLRHCFQLAKDRECGRMEWTALDWNTRAQGVYEALGARKMTEWYLYRLDQEGIQRAASGQKPG